MYLCMYKRAWQVRTKKMLFQYNYALIIYGVQEREKLYGLYAQCVSLYLSARNLCSYLYTLY